MKFLNEILTESVLFEEILNEKTGEKQMFITGPFMSYDTINRNNRIYSKDVLLKEAMRYKQEVVDEQSGWMECGHPENLNINPERICGRVIELWDDPSKKAIMGRAIITETIMGNLIKGLMKSGGKIGVSTRAAGSIKTNKDGINEVQDDLRIIAIDHVLNPSGINCYVSSVMESKEFTLNESGNIVELTEAMEKVILAKHGCNCEIPVKEEKVLGGPDSEASKNAEKKMLESMENFIKNLNPSLMKENVIKTGAKRGALEKLMYQGHKPSKEQSSDNIEHHREMIAHHEEEHRELEAAMKKNREKLEHHQKQLNHHLKLSVKESEELQENENKFHVYDNGGETQDRYTAFSDKEHKEGMKTKKPVEALGMDDHPTHPQGFSQMTSAQVGKHLGKKIEFSSLSDKLQSHIKSRLGE